MLKLIQHKQIFFRQHYEKYIFISPNFGPAESTEDRNFRDEFVSAAKPSEVLFLDKIPSLSELMEYVGTPAMKSLLLFDDMGIQVFQNSLIVDIFTYLSSHGQIDSIVSCHKGSGMAKLGKNFQIVFDQANAIFVWRNLADRDSISQISRKMFPKKASFLSDCLNLANKFLGPFSFLLIDCSISNGLNHRFSCRTNIFPTEENPYPTIWFKNPYF